MAASVSARIFSEAPDVVKGLVMIALGIRESSRTLARVSRGFRHVSIFEQHRNTLQRQQWSMLLFSDMSPDFAKNESLLHSLGARTVDFSTSEQALWVKCFASVSDPPAPLTSEQRSSFVYKHLPHLYHLLEPSTVKEVVSQSSIGAADRTRRAEHVMKISRNRQPTPEQVANYSLGSVFASSLVSRLSKLWEAFAIDGDRLRTQDGELSSLELCIRSYLLVSSPTIQDQYHPITQRLLMLLVLLIRASAGRHQLRGPLSIIVARNFVPSETWGFFIMKKPAAIRALCLSGFNMTQLVHPGAVIDPSNPDGVPFYKCAINKTPTSPLVLSMIAGALDPQHLTSPEIFAIVERILQGIRAREADAHRGLVGFFSPGISERNLMNLIYYSLIQHPDQLGWVPKEFSRLWERNEAILRRTLQED